MVQLIRKGNTSQLNGLKCLSLFNLSLSIKIYISISGQVAKLKLCSCDKKTGFGWTKNIFGRKKWGFFETVHSDLQIVSYNNKNLHRVTETN